MNVIYRVVIAEHAIKRDNGLKRLALVHDTHHHAVPDKAYWVPDTATAIEYESLFKSELGDHIEIIDKRETAA